MERLREGCSFGFVREEDFAAALRAHQVAIDGMKSPQREAADEIMRMKNGG
jgi:hypothetical protein